METRTRWTCATAFAAIYNIGELRDDVAVDGAERGSGGEDGIRRPFGGGQVHGGGLRGGRCGRRR